MIWKVVMSVIKQKKMINRFLCFIGWHQWKFVEWHNLYEGDPYYTRKCKRCHKESYAHNMPIG